MPERSPEQTRSTDAIENDATQSSETSSEATMKPANTITPASTAPTTAPLKPREQAGAVEHMAARRQFLALDPESVEVKEKLNALRPELTTLVTGLRWGGVSVQNTVDALIPLFTIGSLQQWAPVIIPFLFEIDRAGNLIPVWMKIIDMEDPAELDIHANPADTLIGKVRRIAVLMLGNYKSPDLSELLGRLATDPNTSLYATRSLIKQSTTTALQALIKALKSAEGWAKVDLVEACLSFQQTRFNEVLLANSLDNVEGLENFIATPIYRSISLDRYLRGGISIAPLLSQQAALIVGQVLQESLNGPQPLAGTENLPAIFSQPLQPVALALFDGARATPGWQYVLAVHRLATLLGRYWSDISRGVQIAPAAREQIQACLPLMPEIERWMNGPGRDVLLETLKNADEKSLTPVVKILGELRDPRAISLLIAHLDATTTLNDRKHALALGHICETLSRLEDRRATQSLLQLGKRTLFLEERASQPKRRDNLLLGDPGIPASILYAAITRAIGQLNDRNGLDFILQATGDFDPYVRSQAFEALKRVDPTGSDQRSRVAVRGALNDIRDTVARVACQVAAQYRDPDAVPMLRTLLNTRPDLTAAASAALQQIG